MSAAIVTVTGELMPPRLRNIAARLRELRADLGPAATTCEQAADYIERLIDECDAAEARAGRLEHVRAMALRYYLRYVQDEADSAEACGAEQHEDAGWLRDALAETAHGPVEDER